MKMLASLLKREKVLIDGHLGNASWSSEFVISSSVKSDTLLVYSVKSACILLIVTQWHEVKWWNLIAYLTRKR